MSSLKDQCSEIIRTFLQDISFTMPSCEYDLAVESLVEKHFTTQGFSIEFIQKVRPILRWSAGIAVTTYPFNTQHVQTVIGIFTAYAVIIDDLGGEFKDDLQSFITQLFRGSQQNQLLQSFVDFMPIVCEQYGQFNKDMIMKSVVEFIAVCYLEVEEEGQNLFQSNSVDFPQYIRLKSGMAEPYSLFAFPKEIYPEDSCLREYLPAMPYLINFFNYTNDILSFYKESVVSNEQFNFIHNHSRANNITPLQSLQRLSIATANDIQRIRAILSINPKMGANIEQLLHGYVVYHLSQSRYQLSELNIPVVDEAILALSHFEGTGLTHRS